MVDARSALSQLPEGLRNELLAEYKKIVINYREGRWEASELDGGRFSEVAYTILDGYLKGGAYANSASKPSQFDVSCKNLANAAATYPKSARVTVPRVLVALYDIRNNRGVGHVGGDVSANHMDAEYVLHSAQWVMAEFVRLFHSVDVDTATSIVDSLVERVTPMIWEIGDVKRILSPEMSLADSTLVLLHSSTTELTDKTLAGYLEQNSLSNYRRVLRRLHAARLVEYQEGAGLVFLSPLGVKDLEDRVLRRQNR